MNHETHIIKITVDSLGRRLGKALNHVGLLVVEGVVEAEVLLQPLHLGVRASVADDFAALDFGNLAHEAADCPGGPVHNHSLSGLWLAQLQEAEVGSVSGHATAADQMGEGKALEGIFTF